MPERSCESSCVCPPSASETVLPCLTAHFVRRPGWPPSAISETRSAATVRAARGAKRRVCCGVRSTERGPDNPASEAGRGCQQTFPQAGKPVPLCQSLRIGARSVWSGTEIGGAGELALMFEPVKPCAVQRKVSGETRPAESGGRAWPKRPSQMVRHETLGRVAEAGGKSKALPCRLRAQTTEGGSRPQLVWVDSGKAGEQANAVHAVETAWRAAPEPQSRQGAAWSARFDLAT